MSDLISTIKSMQSALDMITNHGGIVSLSALRKAHIIQDRHLGCFASQDDRVTELLFVDWLEYGMYDYVPPDEVEQNDRQNVVQNVDENDIDAAASHCNLTFALDLKALEKYIDWYNSEMQHLRVQIKKDSKLVYALHVQEGINAHLKLRLNYIRRQLGQEGFVDHRIVERLLRQGNLWELQAEERWILYRYWVGRLRNVWLEELRSKEAKLRLEARMYEEVQQKNDADILRKSLVVGMTTTGAAKFQSLLQALKAKIGK
jgi:hypothetical protein